MIFLQRITGKDRNYIPHLTTLCAGLFVLVVVLVAGSVDAADRSMVHIYADGKSRTVLSEANTVKEVLEENEVEVGSIDLVEPGLDTEITPGEFHVNVFRAKPVMIIDGNRSFTINTPYSSPHLIAKSAGLTVYPEDHFAIELVDDFVEKKFIGHKLTITRATPVTVELDGHVFSFRTHASKVRHLLTEKGIVLEGEDFTTIDMDTRITPGLRLAVVRVGHEVVTEERQVPFETRVVSNYDVPYGVTKVQKEGQPGRIVSSYNVVRHDGAEVSRRLIGHTKVSDPIEQVVVKGQRILSSYETNEQILAALRECESRSNYQANTGNGFYGAYQFLSGTWDRIAGRYRPKLVGVRPDLAAPADQDEIVLLNARASKGGFHSQHPGCSSYLNLPKFPF